MPYILNVIDYEYTNIFYISLYFSYSTIYLEDGVSKLSPYTLIANHILYAILLPNFSNVSL